MEMKVLPAELMAKLDIKNFANKPYGQKPSVVIPYEEGVRKEWHFYGENFHDFAFTAILITELVKRSACLPDRQGMVSKPIHLFKNLMLRNGKMQRNMLLK